MQAIFITGKIMSQRRKFMLWKYEVVTLVLDILETFTRNPYTVFKIAIISRIGKNRNPQY